MMIVIKKNKSRPRLGKLGRRTIVLLSVCSALSLILNLFWTMLEQYLFEQPSNNLTKDQPTSVLLQWDNVRQEKKAFEPGPYSYSHNNIIYLTGASITSDYHNRDALWLQFFALGDKPLFGKNHQGKDNCVFHKYPSFLNVSSREDLPVKKWIEMEKEVFSCKIGDRQAKFELIPAKSVDGNTNQAIQVWRCPLYGIDGFEPLLSKMDATLFHQGFVNGDALALTVEVMHGSGENATKFIEFNMPSFEPNVGMNKVRSKPTRMGLQPELPSPMLQQRFNFTLCVIAHANGIVHLPEYVRYHFDVLGVEHIHLGIHAPESDTRQSEAVGAANHILQPDIDNGRITVSAMSWSDSIGLKCPNSYPPMQMTFNQECLYRAKSTSEFVGFWDADEFLLQKNQNASKQQNLVDMLRQLHHEACEDWSFVTFESSTAVRDQTSKATGMVGLDFTRRENATNRVWRKSISQTKNVFLGGIHVPGSCLPPGKSSMSDAVAMDPADGKCAFYVHDAIMVHARGVQSGWSQKDNGDTVSNELQSYLGVKNQTDG